MLGQQNPCPGQAKCDRFVTGGEQRADFVADLLIGHALAGLLINSFQQQGEDVIGPFCLSATLIDETVEQGIQSLLCQMKAVAAGGRKAQQGPNSRQGRTELAECFIGAGVEGVPDILGLVVQVYAEQGFAGDAQGEPHHLLDQVQWL